MEGFYAGVSSISYNFPLLFPHSLSLICTLQCIYMRSLACNRHGGEHPWSLPLSSCAASRPPTPYHIPFLIPYSDRPPTFGGLFSAISSPIALVLLPKGAFRSPLSSSVFGVFFLVFLIALEPVGFRHRTQIFYRIRVSPVSPSAAV